MKNGLKLNIRKPDGSVEEIEGKMVPIKGYSKFKFFAHKTDEKEWCIREFFTGRRLGNAKKEIDAKRNAREYLNKNVNKDVKKLTDHINKSGIINEE